MSRSAADAAASIREAIRVARRGLVERDALLELIALAAVAREHVLVVGPPGTAKSEAARRIAQALGGVYFEYLLGRFTEPSEIFGPVDLRRLRDGIVATETTGMLPEAEIAFLDEVFLGSTAILNTLLGILNERRFRRGHTELQVPLRVCVAAANRVPDDPALAAFADRFLVRVHLEPVADPQLEDLLEGGWSLGEPPTPVSSMAEVDVLAEAARRADLEPVRPVLADAIRRLRKQGIALSDRRLVKLQRLVAAAAALRGATIASAVDLWPIVAAIPEPEGQALAREALAEVLSVSENGALVAAVAETSTGPRARAARIVEAANVVLDLPLGDPTTPLRLEGIAREIDASFAAESLPDEIRAVRERVVAALGQRA